MFSLTARISEVQQQQTWQESHKTQVLLQKKHTLQVFTGRDLKLLFERPGISESRHLF